MKQIKKWLIQFMLATLLVGISQTSYGASTTTKTKYPIVLVHGHLGGSKLFVINYFYGIKNDLTSNGSTVYTPSLSAVNSTTVRGEQLVTYLKSLQAQYGYTKFNLIGHSQGAIDIRYATAKMPNAVASLTSVAGPHAGSYPSDYSLTNTGHNGAIVFDMIGGVNGLLNGKILPQEYQAYLESTSTAGMAAFNAKNPMGLPTSDCGNGVEVDPATGIYMYSVGGISQQTNALDPSDYYLKYQSRLTTKQSDGWIDRCSTHFGLVLKDDFAWNHLDEINQFLGLVGKDQDPVAFYRMHAERLKAKGL